MPYLLMQGVSFAKAESLRFQHFGFFMLRRPLNSITRLRTFHQRLEFSDFEEGLKEEFQCSFLQEAIRLASGDLHINLMRWLQGETLSGHRELIQTFYKYFVRASTRCTPFGLFAGLAYGEISDETMFVSDPGARPVMKISPDFTWQSRLSTALFRNVAVRPSLRVKANSSLVNEGGAYRYIERMQGNYFLNSFNEDETLTAVLGMVGEDVRYEGLIDQLVESGHARDEATGYIDDLLDNDLLEFAEQPTVIGKAFPGKLIEGLNGVNALTKSVNTLREIQSFFDDPAPSLADLDILRDHMTQLDAVHAGETPLKVDSFFTFEKARLSESFVQSTIDSLSELSILNFSVGRQDLESFKESFRFKYDTQEIPLWLALDSEFGIGFDGDFGALDVVGEDQYRNQRHAVSNAVETTGSWWQNYVASKYLRAVASRTREISLTATDLNEIRNLRPKNFTQSLASSAYAFGSIISSGNTSPGNLQFVLAACQGPSAINMLGRFADGCPSLKDQLARIVAYEQEQHPDVILAELVHSPGSKVANVMSRPTLYDYEIEYLGNASVAKEHVILISDLMVSVHDGKIILRSKRLGKRVIPRLSNMHNHQRGLPAYRFLAALQSQDSSFHIGWDWGFLANSDFLPRVSYKNIIVGRATWKLYKTDFQSLSNADVSERLASLDVPKQFVIAFGDNELFIDASVKRSVDLFLAHILKNEVLIVKEFLENRDQSLLMTENEIIANEVVIPFQIKQNSCGRPLALSPTDRSIVTEQFEPGSEWVYIKLYASEGMLDALIRNKIAHFAAGLIERGVVEKFFFVRYHDKESHLRLRFLRRANSTMEEIVSGLRGLLTFELTHKFVSKMQLDTYQRELGRYGRSKIEYCETYFSEDSMAISSYLAGTEAARTVQERLSYAVENVMVMFGAAGILPEELADLCMEARNGLLSELALPLAELSSWRGLTNILVRQKLNSDGPDLYGNRSAGTLREILRDLERNHRNNLIVDLIHMSVNRLFRDNQRYYEAVVYHLIYKIYVAKAKYSTAGSCA